MTTNSATLPVSSPLAALLGSMDTTAGPVDASPQADDAKPAPELAGLPVPAPVDPFQPCRDCGERNFWFNIFGVPICRVCHAPHDGWENVEMTERWCIQDVEDERSRSPVVSSRPMMDSATGPIDWDGGNGYCPGSARCIRDGVEHRRHDCISKTSWLHVWGQRYCSACWPCTDPAARVQEGR